MKKYLHYFLAAVIAPACLSVAAVITIMRVPLTP